MFVCLCFFFYVVFAANIPNNDWIAQETDSETLLTGIAKNIDLIRKIKKKTREKIIKIEN